MLLCSVTEMRGFDVVRGGTGGGAFLLLTVEIKDKRKKKKRAEENGLSFTQLNLKCQLT